MIGPSFFSVHALEDSGVPYTCYSPLSTKYFLDVLANSLNRSGYSFRVACCQCFPIMAMGRFHGYLDG